MEIMRTDFKEIAQAAARAADDKKAVDPIVLDLRKTSDVADYMVIVGVESTVQASAIEGAVEEALSDIGVRRLRREGHARGRWMVLDYGGMVMHILSAEAREFYRLENLWEDARHVVWQKPAAPPARRKTSKTKKSR